MEHSSTALGIAYVRILVPDDNFTRLSKQLTSVLGLPPTTAAATETVWVLDTPITTTSGTARPQLILSVPEEEDEKEALRNGGSGIFEVAFTVEKGKQGGSVNTPYGKISWRPVE